MSGTEPPIKFINSAKKKSLFVKNTDNLEIETASDMSYSPPKSKSNPLPAEPQRPLNRGSVNTKPMNIKNTEGLEYLLNAAKQRENISESEPSDDCGDYDGGGYYQESESDLNQDHSGHFAGQSFYENQQGMGERNQDVYESKQHKKFRKQEMLAKLLALRAKGVELTKNFDMDSSYAEIEFEYYTQKKALDAEASVKFQRQFLVATVTGLEYLNKRFDPIGAKLNGWSESIISDIDSYDEVFRKLYEKYTSRAELPPEIELLVLLVGSAFMFHMTNSILESAMGGAMNRTIVRETVPDGVSDNINSIMKKTNESEMSGPSLNLSGILGGGSGPPLPSVNEPLKKHIEPQYPSMSNDDRFSMVSSDTQISVSKRNNNKSNKIKKTAIKTINI